MESSTLRTPKTGRSRFSKALPAPPSFLDSKKNKTSSLPSLPPTLPSLPPQLPPLSLGLSNVETASPARSPKPIEKDSLLPRIQGGPPVPPPKHLVNREAPSTPTMAAVSRPLDSPLPPLPKMSIPRRPVAALAPAVMPVPTPAPLSPALSQSPVGSYSSLLSAYSNRSSETTPRSSTNSATEVSSAKESSSTVSTVFPHEQQVKDASQQLTIASPGLSRNDTGLPPPPAVKDVQRPHTPPIDQHNAGQSPTATQPIPTLANSSPQQDQLWRRRSLRSEKNLAVPELKLVTSHGSTAASGQNLPQVTQGDSSPQPPPAAPPKPIENGTQSAGSRIPLPRSSNAALPGRNIRPAASRQQISTPQEAMGQKTSRPAKDVSSDDREEAQTAKSDHDVVPQAPRPVHPAVSPMKSMPNIASPVVRLPTPDYESSDVKNPIVETVVSPVSPASSPDLPIDTKSPVTRKPVGDAENQVRHAKSSPALVPKSAFAGRPPMGLPASPAASRERTPNQNQFPARTTSRFGDQYRPTTAAPRRDTASPRGLPVLKTREQQPRQTVDQVRTISENGSAASDETVKPRVAAIDAVSQAGESPSPMTLNEDGTEVVEESDLTDHPGAARFPRNWYKPLPENEVLDARPLEDKHFKCHTRHRYLTAARQRVNPIACRTCGHKDRIAECYICSACHLNVCVSCCGGLRRLRGDLDQLLAQLKEKEIEIQEIPEDTKETARPDSETFTVPRMDPPLTFVIETQ